MDPSSSQVSYSTVPSPIYRKLDTGRQEIRLFELLPADDKDTPIQGRLQQHSLLDKPVYNTISYVWGSPDLTDEAIEVDGKSLQVTPNLQKVLHNLRKPSRESGMLFWIDAICINQQDLAERNHQLGPTSNSHEGDEKTMEAGLQLLGEICANDIWTLEGLGYGFPDLNSTENSKSPGAAATKNWKLTEEEVSALEHVLVYPQIWNRIWVVQELSCAPRVVLMAGNARLEWDRIAQFLGPLPPSDAFHRQFGSHGNLVRRDLSTLLVQLKRIHDQRTLTQKGARQELFDVLARWSGSASTDPRDMIYGVLGLAPRDLRLPVDYARTLPAVHLDAARAIIDLSANLDIIAQNPWRQDKTDSIPRMEPHRKQLLQLPSWVPTFSVPLRPADQRRRLLFAQRSIFNAGPSHCQVPCVIADDGALRTRGVVLDTVGREIFGQGRELCHPRDPLPHVSMHACVGGDLLDTSSQAYVSGESAFTAYWRTLATDRTGFPMNRLHPDQIESLDRTLRGRMKESISRYNLLFEPNTGSNEQGMPKSLPLTRTEDVDRDVNDPCAEEWTHLFQNTICDSVWRFTDTHWGFNVTARGLYAMLLRGSAQQCDTIACLEGAKVPLVLRQRAADETAAVKAPRFEVIGPAYVHGFMDLEAYDSVELRGRLRLQTEDIFLV